MFFNRYILTMVLISALMVLVCGTIVYNTFLVYVPPGHMLILTAKNGDEMAPGQILAKPGQKGILEDVLGEGLHFVMPIIYQTEVKPNLKVPPGQIGVVISRIGKIAAQGKILVDDDEQGIRRRILTPGSYRLNPYGYKVELKEALEIDAGFVGFVTSLVGADPTVRDPNVGRSEKNASGTSFTPFAEEGEKGVRRNVLPPGLYFLNPYEYRVQQVEIGVNQVNFLERNNIRFPSRDAFDISVEATVEWELLPENVAEVMSEFGNKQAIEEKVIVPQSKSIGRIQGSSYKAKEFLLGVEREKFQQTFTRELERICEHKNVSIHSAFIRHLTIPDNLLMPIRESFIAVEKEKTAKVWEETKKSAGDLEREKAMISQRRAEVTAQTNALVNTVKAEADQEMGKIEAETRLLISQKQQEIASIEASKTVMLGEANATVTRIRGEAGSRGIEAKVKAFGDNPRAFVHYSFARQIPSDLKIKLIYSGNGTFWTDLKGLGGISDLAGMKILKDDRPSDQPTDNSH